MFRRYPQWIRCSVYTILLSGVFGGLWFIPGFRGWLNQVQILKDQKEQNKDEKEQEEGSEEQKEEQS